MLWPDEVVLITIFSTSDKKCIENVDIIRFWLTFDKLSMKLQHNGQNYLSSTAKNSKRIKTIWFEKNNFVALL